MSAFIDRYRARFGVELVCRTLGVSASAYYQRASGERSARAVEDERLTAKIRKVFAENYECYGVQRMHAALVRDGEQVGRDQVTRLMRAAGLRGAKRRGKPWRTTISDPAAQKRPDLVAAGFHRNGAGPPVGRRLHVSADVGGQGVLQLHDRRVLADDRRLAASPRHMRTDLVLGRVADGARDPPARRGLHAHRHIPIRGRSTSARTTRRCSTTRSVLASVGSVGDAYDNAMAESFVDSSKTELIKDRVWHSNTKLELAIVEWVAWFNTRRLHSSIGNRPPAEHEAEWRRLAAQPNSALVAGEHCSP